MSNNKETTTKTITVAFLLCLVCAAIVASSVIFLKPVQQKNLDLYLKTNILAAAGMLKENASKAEIESTFKTITPKLVNLDTGEYATPEDVGKRSVKDYDQRKASRDPKLSSPIPGDEDIAVIKRRAKYAKIYLVEKKGKIEKIILPIHGYGLWSTLYGFVALDSDANTVAGLGFYEQLETPGLGGEVDNPRWKALWPGKKIYNLQKSQDPQITLVKGGVDTSRPDAIYKVDALSGASLTSRGVTNLLQYWLGKHGFEKYLENVRKGV